MRPFFIGMLPFLVLMLAAGAAILWATTKRFAALIQLIASSVVVLLLGVEELARHLSQTGRPEFWQWIRNPSIEAAGQIAIVISLIAFPVAYIWHALNERRI